ncbi:arp2/3 complex subunit [Tilletia horrida]|uniref:Actin-related protein 2/3 complex subunit 5 n=1 Tax=Tilletia horrida TaxID=155126 RepID=A0AAN6JNK1_9BASI|nr:arp2/3 complex subunit [Tilletia horrida]
MDNFRSIDIDQYDEDVLDESELVEQDPRSAADLLSIAKQKAGQVRGLIGQGDLLQALQITLADPPYNPEAEDAKLATLTSLLDVLNSTRATEITPTLKGLDLLERDTLMKFLYKGLAKPEMGASAVLLTWHEKLTELAGTGCIVRVMTDRRTV